jgi:hypothetical protein
MIASKTEPLHLLTVLGETLGAFLGPGSFSSQNKEMEGPVDVYYDCHCSDRNDCVVGGKGIMAEISRDA